MVKEESFQEAIVVFLPEENWLRSDAAVYQMVNMASSDGNISSRH